MHKRTVSKGVLKFALKLQQYNSTSGPTREDERGVKGVRVLAVVGTTMSKSFGDTGVL